MVVNFSFLLFLALLWSFDIFCALLDALDGSRSIGLLIIRLKFNKKLLKLIEIHFAIVILIILLHHFSCVVFCKPVQKWKNLNELLVVFHEPFTILFKEHKALIKILSSVLGFEQLGTLQEFFQIDFSVSIWICKSEKLNNLILILQNSLVINQEVMLVAFNLLSWELSVIVCVHCSEYLRIICLLLNWHDLSILIIESCFL